MTAKHSLRFFAVTIGTITLLSAFQAGRTPAGDVAALVKAYLSLGHPPGWDGIDALPGIRWAAPQPTTLTNCLPDGSCYARQGTATVAGATMQAMATGARTMVTHLYVRNTVAQVGEDAVLAAVRSAGMTADLARCPVTGGTGTTNWYRVKGAGITSGVFAIQTVRTPRPSEGFTVQAGDELPALQPNQVSMYTEQCAPGAARTAAPTVVPHERLAEVVVALLVPTSKAALAWTDLPGLGTGIEWIAAPRSFPTGTTQSGSANYGGRRFSVQASGTATQVKAITLEETGGYHPRGEHMLGVVYTKGIAVRLVRCGPVYTESSNNWYSLNSTRTRPAMIRQSLSWSGSSSANSVADSYELRLDGTLPARDPRDRDPGAGGCQ